MAGGLGDQDNGEELLKKTWLKSRISRLSLRVLALLGDVRNETDDSTTPPPTWLDVLE
jgi:hypothetical protein